MLEASSDLRDKLHANTVFFREAMKEAGFAVPDHPYPHPIVVRAAYTLF